MDGVRVPIWLPPEPVRCGALLDDPYEPHEVCLAEAPNSGRSFCCGWHWVSQEAEAAGLEQAREDIARYEYQCATASQWRALPLIVLAGL